MNKLKWLVLLSGNTQSKDWDFQKKKKKKGERKKRVGEREKKKTFDKIHPELLAPLAAIINFLQSAFDLTII